MPTLTEYIVSRLTGAGFVVEDLASVLWNTNIDYADDRTSWVPVDVGQFRTVADSIDATAVTPSARERLRFIIQTAEGNSAIFQWSNDVMDFVAVQARPPILVINASDLTT